MGIKLFHRVEWRVDGEVYIAVVSTKPGDSAFSKDLEVALEQARDHKAKHIILNIERLAYLQTHDVWQLVQAHKALRPNDGKLALVRPRGKVKSLLELLKLDRVFPIYEDEEAALAWIREDRAPSTP